MVMNWKGVVPFERTKGATTLKFKSAGILNNVLVKKGKPVGSYIENNVLVTKNNASVKIENI